MAWLFGREVIGSDTGAPAVRQIAGPGSPANLFAGAGGAIKFLKRHSKTVAALLALLLPTAAYAQPEQGGGGEANLVLPDLTTVQFFGMNGHALLMIGLLFCVGGLLFGLTIYVQLKNLPVHRTRSEER